jgi:PatG C-terminal
VEQTESIEAPANHPAQENKPAMSGGSPSNRTISSFSPQAGAAPGPACGSAANAAPPTFVYALGRIAPRFPNLSAEKEFVQVAGREGADKTAKLTDQGVFHAILSKQENRYLARQMCWVFSIQGLETYILLPRDPADLDLLIEAIRPAPSPLDMDVVIGVRGPVAPPEICNGLMIPIVGFDQIYSFDRDSLLKSIPKAAKAGKESTAEAAEVLDRIIQMTDNAGATDEHRALNYLVVRYPAIYATTAEAFARNCSLTDVNARRSPISGTRKIVDVIFSFTNRGTDVVEKFFTRVDVTEEFPFLVTKMSPYYDR